MDKQAAYKAAFLKELIQGGKALASKADESYIMDAVRSARPQHIRSIFKEEPMTLHGTVLNSLRENGAVGINPIMKTINRGRLLLGDIDTALGAAAVGKKGLLDPASKSLRKSVFTFSKGNERSIPKDAYGMKGTRQQSRPSITAPLGFVSSLAVPGLAMLKGNEILAGLKNKKNSLADVQNNGVQGGYPGGE